MHAAHLTSVRSEDLKKELKHSYMHGIYNADGSRPHSTFNFLIDASGAVWYARTHGLIHISDQDQVIAASAAINNSMVMRASTTAFIPSSFVRRGRSWSHAKRMSLNVATAYSIYIYIYTPSCRLCRDALNYVSTCMQGLKKVGDEHVDRHHGEDDAAVAVHHLVDEADHDHAGSGGGGGVQRRRRPSSSSPNNTSGSSGDTASTSEWLHQQYCSDGGGGAGMSVRVLALGLGVGPPATATATATPPSLEMSLGRQGWQTMVEQCGVGGEFESSPSAAAKELTLLRCL